MRSENRKWEQSFLPSLQGACLVGVSREGIRFELGFEGCVGHAWGWGDVGGKGCFWGGSLLHRGTAVWPGSPGGAVETRSPAAGGLCLTRCCLGGLAAWWAVDVQS